MNSLANGLTDINILLDDHSYAHQGSEYQRLFGEDDRAYRAAPLPPAPQPEPVLLEFPAAKRRKDEYCPHARHHGRYAKKSDPTQFGSAPFSCGRGDCPGCFAFRKRRHWEHYATLFSQVYQNCEAIYFLTVGMARWEALRKAARRSGDQLVGVPQPNDLIDVYTTTPLPESRRLSLECALEAFQVSLDTAPTPGAGQRLVRCSRGWSIGTSDQTPSEWELCGRMANLTVEDLLAIGEEFGVPMQRGRGQMIATWTLPADMPPERQAAFHRALSVPRHRRQNPLLREMAQHGHGPPGGLAEAG